MGRRSTRTASLFRTRGMPPNCATSGFFPRPRGKVAWRHVLFPMRGLNGGSEAFGHRSGRAAIFGRQGVGQGLEDDPSVSAEPGDIDSEQIVLDEAPIFVLIGPQDGYNLKQQASESRRSGFPPRRYKSGLLFTTSFWDS